MMLLGAQNHEAARQSPYDLGAVFGLVVLSGSNPGNYAMRGQALFVAVAFSSVAGLAQPGLATEAQSRLNRPEIIRELSRAPDDPLWNFLVGLAYESTATASTEERGLARVGYGMALRHDPQFWQAAYQLGLMNLEDRDAFAAQRLLLQAAMAAPGQPRVLRALARASYCAGDIAVAAAALERAERLAPAQGDQELLTVALVASAQQDQAKLDAVLPQLSPTLRDAVLNRFAVPRKPAVQSALAGDAKPAAGTAGMAVVDVVMIRRSEGASTSSGVNLLDALSLQFGSNLLNRSWSTVTDRIDPTLSTSTIKSDSGVQLTIPAVTYSLNIANARGNTSRIDERPTLLVYDGVEARFFNGGTLTFSTDGQLNSSSQTREVGLSLSVKPTFINPDTVNLAVNVSLENFIAAPPAGTFRQAVQTEKSSTQIAADVKFGQTLLVSAGASKKTTKTNSKTPLLGDLPVLGKLFAVSAESRQDSDLLVLLSLRRVPGTNSDAISAEEERRLGILRAQLFPDLVDHDRLEPEARQLFYRIDNPARGELKEYLAPLTGAGALKHLLVAGPRTR